MYIITRCAKKYDVFFYVCRYIVLVMSRSPACLWYKVPTSQPAGHVPRVPTTAVVAARQRTGRVVPFPELNHRKPRHRKAQERIDPAQIHGASC